MWSDRFYYLNIYKDEKLSEYFDKGELRKYISSIPELVESGKFEFTNKESFPFTELLMLNARSIQS
jgi:hypothetical protein